MSLSLITISVNLLSGKTLIFLWDAGIESIFSQTGHIINLPQRYVRIYADHFGVIPGILIEVATDGNGKETCWKSSVYTYTLLESAWNHSNIVFPPYHFSNRETNFHHTSDRLTGYQGKPTIIVFHGNKF
jgi:hypothetical protein